MGILTSTVAQDIARPGIGGALVYRKSSRGVVKLAATDGGQLSSHERHLLIMVDGRRTLADLSDLFGSEKLKLLSLLAELEAKGLVKRVDPSVDAGLGGAITQFGATVPAAAPATGTRDRIAPPRTASPRALPPGRDARPPGRDARPPRFYPPAVITPRRELAPPGPFSVDEHPLSWFVLVLTLTIAGSNWFAHRVHSELSQFWWSDYKQARPIDSFSGSMSTGSVGAGQSDRPSPIRPALEPHVAMASPAVSAQPIVPRPTAHAAPNAPSRVVSRIAPRGHPGEPAKAPVVQTALSPAAGLAQTPAAQTAVPVVTTPDTAKPASGTEVAGTQAAQPTSEAPGLRPLRHDPPRIPAKAVQDGIVEGHAQVRLWITPEGKVDQVDVLEASPRGVLDDEVKRVLSLWTFEPPGHPVDEVVQLTLEP